MGAASKGPDGSKEEKGCTTEELQQLREEIKKTLNSVKRECSRGISGKKNLEKLRSGMARATMRHPKPLGA